MIILYKIVSLLEYLRIPSLNANSFDNKIFPLENYFLLVNITLQFSNLFFN